MVNTVAEPGLWRALALSPDNARLAYERNPVGNTAIWVYEFARGLATPLTSGTAADEFPVWSPDGSRIAFFSSRSPPGIYQRASNGAGEDQLLFKVDQGQVFIPSSGGWSRDGRFMMLTSNPEAASGNNLWVLSLADHKIVPLVKSEPRAAGGRFSPDNHWVAYTSSKTGNNEAYIVPFNPNFVSGSGNASTGAEILVSKGGGTAPTGAVTARKSFTSPPTAAL